MKLDSRALWVELLAAPALLLGWLGLVLYQHGQPGGVTIEQLAFGGLLLPAHLARALAWRGALEAPGPAAIGLELAALVTLGLGWTQTALVLGTLVALGQVALVRPQEPGPLARPTRALGWLALIGALGALGLAAQQGRPTVPTRLLLLLPLLLEAWRGPQDEGAGLRRFAAGCAVAVLALSRLEVLLGLFAGAFALAAAGVAHSGGSRRAVLRAAFPALVLALGYAAGEVLIRVAFGRGAASIAVGKSEVEPGGETTWTPPAGAGGEAAEPVVNRWNARGYHDVDHELPKPAGALRVLVLGDSFVEGRQVEREQLFHRQLERRLAERLGRPVEAIALGKSGWGQGEALAALEAEGLAYQPDLVLCEFLPANDVRDNHPELEAAAERELVRSSWARPLQIDAARKRLLLAERLCGKLDQVLRRLSGSSGWLDAGVYEEQPQRLGEAWGEAWRRTEALLGQLHERAREAGAGLGFVVFPAQHEAEAHAAARDDYAYPARRVRERCAAARIPCLDLTPTFAAVPEIPALYWAGDGHWTAAGHALAAEATARWLAEGPLRERLASPAPPR